MPLSVRMGALALSLVMGASALPAPLVLPAAAAVEEAAEEAAEPSVSRWASPAEKRKAMAERRAALLRQAREEAEQSGSVSKAEAAKEAAKPAGTDLQSMLQSLSSQVGAGGERSRLRGRRRCRWPQGRQAGVQARRTRLAAAQPPPLPPCFLSQQYDQLTGSGSKPAAPKAEAPAAPAAPTAEAAKPAAPAFSLPKFSAPSFEAPKIDMPKVEAPKFELPKVELPKASADQMGVVLG